MVVNEVVRLMGTVLWEGWFGLCLPAVFVVTLTYRLYRGYIYIDVMVIYIYIYKKKKNIYIYI